MPLTDANLLRSFFSIPFVTLKVIALIHWQAFKLWRKKIPFHRKAEQPELQRGVYRPFRQNSPSGKAAPSGSVTSSGKADKK